MHFDIKQQTNKEMKVEKTTNYSKFVFNYEQREISEKHVRAIAESIARHGYIHSKPVQVYKQGAHWVIVDGHHRFQACKALGIPVHYMVDDATAQEHMADENALVKKWTLQDFVKLYASRGNQNYLKILYYVDRGIPLTIAVGMLAGHVGSSGSNIMNKVKNGRFEVFTELNIQWLVQVIEELSGRNSACASRTFLHSMSKCLCCSDFDRDHFFHKLRTNLAMMDKTSNVDQMMNQVEAIYNFRSREVIPLQYLVNKASQERNPAKK